MLRWIKKNKERLYAFNMWITANDGRRVKIVVPVGMTVGELEDQLHDRYWLKNNAPLKEPSSD